MSRLLPLSEGSRHALGQRKAALDVGRRDERKPRRTIFFHFSDCKNILNCPRLDQIDQEYERCCHPNFSQFLYPSPKVPNRKYQSPVGPGPDVDG